MPPQVRLWNSRVTYQYSRSRPAVGSESMKNYAQLRLAIISALALCLLPAMPSMAEPLLVAPTPIHSAAGYSRIGNATQPEAVINIENGLFTTYAPPGWWSADWTLEVAGADTRIHNRWKGTYLAVQRGRVQMVPINSPGAGIDWRIEPVAERPGNYRIINRSTGQYLGTSISGLDLRPLVPDDLFSQWQISNLAPVVSPSPEAARISVDPACLSTVAWLVQPQGEDIRLNGCRPAGQIGVPDDQGWTSFAAPDGQQIDVRNVAMNGSAIMFDVRVSSGGSGVFISHVMGTPDAQGVLKAGTFDVTAVPQ